MTRKLKFTKFGLAENPTGYQVSMGYKDRTLLGDVIGFERSETRGVVQLIVRHFNGEPWPLKPVALLVDVLGPRF